MKRGFAPSYLTQVFLCFAVIAKADEPVKPEAASPPSAVQEIMGRTKREYRKARFYKPAEGNPSKIEYKLAPLIVGESNERSSTAIATLHKSEAARIPRQSAATVYFSTGSVTTGGGKLDEVFYLWWHYPVLDCLRCGYLLPVFIPRGVRIVLGSDDMPILWEALEGPSKPRVFYVSQQLEQAAKQQFGDPHPKRNFSIEKSPEDNPDVLVTRVLEDGPVPMGPYVYIDADCGRAISTIHCRCSPSQFDEVMETLEYELQPIESIDAKWLREHGETNIEKLLNSEPLDKLFRWPKM